MLVYRSIRERLLGQEKETCGITASLDVADDVSHFLLPGSHSTVIDLT